MKLQKMAAIFARAAILAVAVFSRETAAYSIGSRSTLTNDCPEIPGLTITNVDGHCLHFGEQEMTYSDASTVCTNAGGTVYEGRFTGEWNATNTIASEKWGAHYNYFLGLIYDTAESQFKFVSDGSDATSYVNRVSQDYKCTDLISSFITETDCDTASNFICDFGYTEQGEHDNMACSGPFIKVKAADYTGDAPDYKEATVSYRSTGYIGTTDGFTTDATTGEVNFLVGRSSIDDVIEIIVTPTDTDYVASVIKIRVSSDDLGRVVLTHVPLHLKDRTQVSIVWSTNDNLDLKLQFDAETPADVTVDKDFAGDEKVESYAVEDADTNDFFVWAVNQAGTHITMSGDVTLYITSKRGLPMTTVFIPETPTAHGNEHLFGVIKQSPATYPTFVPLGVTQIVEYDELLFDV